jgi:hypothetical protein
MTALASLAALIAGATATFAQASSSMAELRGKVTDADGAAIANAKLTLTDLVKGPCTAPGAVPLADFNLRGRRDRKATEPLGFTSAADPRQLQFGVRFNF